MKKYILIGGLVLTILLAGCSTAENTEVNTYTDPATTINVSVNQEFILALESNPTTGYSWQETHEADMLTLVNDQYQAKETAPNVVGAGGTHYFTYKALKKGETKVTLVYLRPWEQQSPTDTPYTFTANDKTEIFTVNIK
jgi:inhibitor of cysteine peptidase